MAATVEVRAGNRLETLAAWLAAGIRGAPLDPFEPERIVVPHPTLGRWLTLQIASNLGIAANLSIELPAQFGWSIMRNALGSLSPETPFAPDRLRWRIFEALDGFAGPGTEPATRYLQDGDARKRFELADRLARVYDRCLLYRPDWIRAWEGGETPHWQARLWQRLTAQVTEPCHWVAAIDAFRKEAGNASWGNDRDLPRRVSFFGVATLSPSYLDMLRQAGNHIDVHLYMLSPCREYWSDIASRRAIRHRADRHDPADEYRTEGNELLGAWGKLGRDMQALLLDAELSTGTPEEHYDEPESDSSLAALQRDILDLRLASQASPTAGADADDSVQIHVCHSPMREAEVLHDRLLGLFDDHDDIQPADVLVLTPNIVEYAPAIEAVFAAADVIPFNIARPRASATRAVQAFLDLLALPGSRYGAESVMAPLESAAVRDRFRIAERHLPKLREWVREAGIRWGIDAGHREEEGLPAFDGHGWRQGLSRLVLGYAMEGDDTLFEGVAPCSTDSAGFAGDNELLGRFVEYCEGVIELHSWKDRERAVSDWMETLGTWVDAFFATDWQNAAETATVTRLVTDLGAECDVDSAITFAVLRDALAAAAASMSRPAARLAEGITVTSLGIGQAFPAEVVCAVGMNDGSFPRRPSPSSFDLVDADDERTGDRNVRDEDRFAFLEALLAARRCFLVSYTGRNVRDDKPIPPSVVVDELREYLDKRFGRTFETRHPLQPFSRRYFEPDGALWSYSAPMCDAAHATLVDDAGNSAWERLSVPVETVDDPNRRKRVDLDELIRFFGNPTRAFLQNRLGIRLEIDEIALADDEPLALDGLEQWQLKTDMFESRRRNASDERIQALMQTRGRLPNGGPGGLVHDDALADVLELREALEEYEDALAATPRDIGLDLGDFRLTGSLEGVDAEGNILFWRIGRTREKDRIATWLKLLAWVVRNDDPADAHLVCLAPGGVEKTTLKGPDGADAHRLLECWLEAWWRGTAEMLAFSPPASMAYASAVAKSGDTRKALNEARRSWERNYDELENTYVSLAYDDADPFSKPAFVELAEGLLKPLLEAEQ